MIRSRISSGMASRSLISSAIGAPSMYSIVMNGCPSCSPTSNTMMMF
jgi:hypothetical protein